MSTRHFELHILIMPQIIKIYEKNDIHIIRIYTILNNKVRSSLTL